MYYNIAEKNVKKFKEQIEKNIEKRQAIADDSFDELEEVSRYDSCQTTGDYWFMKTIEAIARNGYLDEHPRPVYSDGVPAHTLSTNHILHIYDLANGEFPFITYRPIAYRNAIKEILWIYQDQTSDLKILEDKYNIHWWNEWESKDRPGTIGQRYGATVKRYDLVNRLIKGLKENPFSRRHIMCMWQETDLAETDGLSPCAFETQWNVRKENGIYYLDMILIQRSSDFATAGQINGIQYCALLMMIAKTCGYTPGRFSHLFTNVQIYDRHLDQIVIMMNRESIKCTPMLKLNTDKTDFYSFTIDDFELIDYPIEKIKEKNPQLKFDLGI